MTLLTKGQMQALKNGLNVDGSPSSATHKNNVLRTAKVRIFESLSTLKTVYKDVPELRPLIRECLDWYEKERGGIVKQVTASSKKPEPQVENPHGFPENVEDLPVFEPDESKAFAGFKPV